MTIKFLNACRWLHTGGLFWLMMGIFVLSTNSSGQVYAMDLDTLLEQVKQSRLSISKKNQLREQRFKQQRDKRKELLLQASNELELSLNHSRQLKETLKKNDAILADIEQKITDNSVNLGELFGVVRQISGETLANFNHSMVSVQFPQRGELLKKLSDSQSLPSIKDLNQLWYEMQRQMTESGKTSQFRHIIITADGNEEERLITRIGEFNTVSNGRYLQYLSKSNQLVELNRQPPKNFLTMAQKLEQTHQGEVAFAIDPSQGTLLSLLTQMPDIEERIRQGGVIGYIILAIGILALLIALERYAYLGITEYKMSKQRKANKPSLNNPLGRIMQIYHQLRDSSIETLSLKLDEAILTETPRLEKRLLILGLFATVAPLLGLLGTVMGMIETFQSIALFGTGDPKLMSGGISQALITTGLGLMVAVPIVLFHGFLQTKSNRLIQVLDEESAGFIAQLAEQQNEAEHIK